MVQTAELDNTFGDLHALRGNLILNDSIVFSKEHDALISLETLRTTRLSPIASRALLAFAARPFQVIKRDDLLRALWYNHGFVVTENSLNQTVCKLRENFRSIDIGIDLIKTIPRIGYSFVSTVQMDYRPVREIIASCHNVRPETSSVA